MSFGLSKVQTALVTAHPQDALVVGAAGSGKTYALANRLLALRYLHDVPFTEFTALFHTASARQSAIALLKNIASVEGCDVDGNVLDSVVRSVHSKALEFASDLLDPQTRVFDLLGIENVALQEDAEHRPGGTFSAAIQAANASPLTGGKISIEQRRLLEAVFSRCCEDEQFATDLDTTVRESLTSPPLPCDHKDVREAMTRVEPIAAIDAAYCDLIEQDWTSCGLWPIQGVRIHADDGSRYKLDIDGHALIANGYIPETRSFVILGARNRIREIALPSSGSSDMSMSRITWNKSRLALGASGYRVLFAKKVSDLKSLSLKLACLSGNRKGVLHDFVIDDGSGYGVESILDAIYHAGRFAENLALDPRSLNGVEAVIKDSHSRVFARMVRRFFEVLYRVFDERQIVSVAQILRRMHVDGDLLGRVALDKLQTMRHLLIDDYQDVSPLVDDFIASVQKRLQSTEQEPGKTSLMCFGDDAQAIRSKFGGTSRRLLNFPATRAPGLRFTLEQNFRSVMPLATSVALIRAGLAKRKGVDIAQHGKSRAHFAGKSIVLASRCQPWEALRTVDLLLRRLSQPETLLVLGLANDDAIFKEVRDRLSASADARLTIDTLENSKGREADAVLIIGDTAPSLDTRLLNPMYVAAGLDERSGGYDKVQTQEARRRSYVAVSRARRICVWLCNQYDGGAQAEIARTLGLQSRTSYSAVKRNIDEMFLALRHDDAKQEPLLKNHPETIA